VPLGNVVEVRGLVRGTTAADVEVRVLFALKVRFMVDSWFGRLFSNGAVRLFHLKQHPPKPRRTSSSASHSNCPHRQTQL
jgi:hypothetical protein